MLIIFTIYNLPLLFSLPAVRSVQSTISKINRADFLIDLVESNIFNSCSNQEHLVNLMIEK